MSDEPLETDDRFPSGPWVGFWMQRSLYGQGRQRMELRLTFAEGGLTGEGRDCLDEFTVRGRYDTSSGEVHFTKRHLTLGYDVFYKGFNEGKGIWGL